ncbi:MAG: hypothetical protein IPN43_11020 [Chitinophagaceae bacterium]|nr:hypothetical protein [Chitinophagaceae bacterium]
MLLASCRTLIAQEEFNKSYLVYTKKLHDSILQAAKADYYMGKEFNNTVTVTAVPYYQFKYNSIIPLTDSTAVQFLQVNDILGYGIIKKRDKLFGVGKKYWQGKDQYQVDFVSEGDLLGPIYRTELKLIPAAEKLSNTYFFVYFFSTESRYYTSIGFLDKGQLKFVDTSLQVFSATDFLCNRYGSVEKYIELGQKSQTAIDLYLSKIESSDSTIKKMNCINVISNDYQEWAINIPVDTAKVLYLFFKEMDSIVKLKKCQKQLLQEKILLKLKMNEENYSHNGNIQFYNKEISSTIMEVLTEDQYYLYANQRQLNQDLVIKARNFLWKIYFIDNNEKRKLQKLPPENSEEVIKRIRKDIFNIYRSKQ